MPADFHLPLLRQADVLLPMAFEPSELQYRDRMWLSVVGRLKPDLGARAAQSDLDVLGPRIFARR